MTGLVARERLHMYAPLHITPTLDLQERKGLEDLAVCVSMYKHQGSHRRTRSDDMSPRSDSG